MDGGGGIVDCETEFEGIALSFFLSLELLLDARALAVCALGVDVSCVDSMSLIRVRGRIMPYNWLMKSPRSMLSASPGKRENAHLKMNANDVDMTTEHMVDKK